MGDIGQLLEPQIPILRRYARVLARDGVRAEDLVQSALLRALSRQHLWQEGSDLRAWLCTILHNEFINQVRKRVRAEERQADAALRPAAMPGSDPEISYRFRETVNAMGSLPGWQQEVLLRACLTGENYREIADGLGVPIGTVRSRLARARERLRHMTEHDAPAKRHKTVVRKAA